MWSVTPVSDVEVATVEEPEELPVATSSNLTALAAVSWSLKCHEKPVLKKICADVIRTWSLPPIKAPPVWQTAKPVCASSKSSTTSQLVVNPA